MSPQILKSREKLTCWSVKRLRARGTPWEDQLLSATQRVSRMTAPGDVPKGEERDSQARYISCWLGFFSPLMSLSTELKTEVGSRVLTNPQPPH